MENEALELMEVHLDVLYSRDEQGRLRAVNEPPWLPAPRLWMGRTSAGNLWSLRYDLPQSIVRELERLCRDEPVAAELRPAPRNRAAIMAVLESHAPVVDEYRGPAYTLPDALPPVRDGVVVITSANAGLLERWFSAWLPRPSDAGFGPLVAVLQDGHAVAICDSARCSPRACEAGLETAEAYRGRGHASAAVAGWARAVRAGGRLPLYSTWWANQASQGVARKLGMLQYGEDWSLG